MSIKKIAHMVGTSPATVSRVLSNPDYRCQEEGLRNRIWEAAMELNYVPNIAAKSLRSGTPVNGTKVYYINVLVTRTEGEASDPFLDELLRIIESEIHKAGNILHKVWYVSEFSNERRSRLMDLERTITSLYEGCDGKTDGLIVVGKCYKDALIRLERKFKNIVSVNRNSSFHMVDEVTCNGQKTAAQAVEYLISLGHREIGYVGECHNESRFKGFMDTLNKHDIEPVNTYIYESQQSEAAGYEVMERIMKSEDIPTALYCANDIIAIGILKSLSKKKKWNFNISVIASDDIDKAQFSTPMLSTVQLPKEEMGMFAVRILTDRICGGHKSVVTLELSTKLIKRESCYNSFDGIGEYII